MGTSVEFSQLQPGDLVFYAKNGSVNHVAIYIGNGQVIHASSPKTGIKISSLNYRTPYCARRFL
jgi:cell wall-associated NlpC family hydrolase